MPKRSEKIIPATPGDYSRLSACMGSTCNARRAGTQLAASASPQRNIELKTNARGFISLLLATFQAEHPQLIVTCYEDPSVCNNRNKVRVPPHVWPGPSLRLKQRFHDGAGLWIECIQIDGRVAAGSWV